MNRDKVARVLSMTIVIVVGFFQSTFCIPMGSVWKHDRDDSTVKLLETRGQVLN